MTMFDDVGEFHRKFDLPATAPDRVGRLPDLEIWQYRLKFLQEELSEVVQAYETGRTADFLDGLVDLAWVAMGTAHYAGLPFNEAWREVKRANLDKVRASELPAGEHKPWRGAGDIAKPPGWLAPRLRELISSHNRVARVNARPGTLVEKIEAFGVPVEIRVKCDGNHGGPRCADPECWNQDGPPSAVVATPTPSADGTSSGDGLLDELEFHRVFGGGRP